VEEIALIVYGDGGELGSFQIFAENLKRDLEKKYTTVIVKYVNRDHGFFNTILTVPSAKQKIAELHIFSHSIGAGLFLGYKDTAVQNRRDNTWRTAFMAGRKVTYLQAVNTEVGGVQTDDLLLSTYTSKKAQYRDQFTKTAFIKIWGCNSGIKNWVYSDGGVTDPADTSEPYYWRAFNTTNVPKPSIAQALAKFFNVKVYGAKSGASIEVKHNKKWISTKKYKQKVGHWPSGVLPHRLVPDRGSYVEYTP
jgi:hypothetical protein